MNPDVLKLKGKVVEIPCSLDLARRLIHHEAGIARLLHPGPLAGGLVHRVAGFLLAEITAKRWTSS